MHNVFHIRITWPRGFVLFTRCQRRAHGVNAGYEFAIFSNHVINRFAHTRHMFHIGHHIRAVSDFNPDVRNV